MRYIALPDSHPHRVSFYLAMEEYVARQVQTTDDCFFMWQVEPSVIAGRNQVIENEVNINYCRQHHIQIFRRKSGGGCVYADQSNVMFSYITHSKKVETTFHRYISLVTETLQQLGIAATTSGRNDILIDGKKVSGNAFYNLPGRAIVHGTMLYDTCAEHMMAAITPPAEKLKRKGVESVRAHITLLKDHTDLTLQQFIAHVKQYLCNETLMLSPDSVQDICEIEKQYLSDDFIFPHHAHRSTAPASQSDSADYTIQQSAYIKNVGQVEASITLHRNHISHINLQGDFFVLGDIDATIVKPLIGQPYNEDAISRMLPQKTDEVIMNLHHDDLVQLLFNKAEQL